MSELWAEVAPRITDLEPAAWDALVDEDDPFSEHALGFTSSAAASCPRRSTAPTGSAILASPPRSPHTFSGRPPWSCAAR